ncbi:MAG TPA: response regulator, partial [Gemmatimonadales bacterium]|nr:response regulator [Gemmatimonadales bacterium]
LWESGLRHVVDGDTTVDELLRVTDVPSGEDGESASGGRRRPGAAAGRPAPAATPAVVATPGAAPASSLDFTMDMELLDEIAPPAETAGDRRRGFKVLLVDDEDQLRKVMRDLLEREGYTVHEAGDGVQALDQVDRHAPDIVVLDLNLPGLDGYEVLSRLRSRPATRQIPVVVLTAKGDEDNEVRVFELGADDFLSKPFRARALAARLEAVLGRRAS